MFRVCVYFIAWLRPSLNYNRLRVQMQLIVWTLSMNYDRKEKSNSGSFFIWCRHFQTIFLGLPKSILFFAWIKAKEKWRHWTADVNEGVIPTRSNRMKFRLDTDEVSVKRVMFSKSIIHLLSERNTKEIKRDINIVKLNILNFQNVVILQTAGVHKNTQTSLIYTLLNQKPSSV